MLDKLSKESIVHIYLLFDRKDTWTVQELKYDFKDSNIFKAECLSWLKNRFEVGNSQIEGLSNLDEMDNAIYLYDYGEPTEELKRLIELYRRKHRLEVYRKSSKLGTPDASILQIEDESLRLMVYRKIYPVELIDPKKHLYIVESDSLFERFEKDIIKISHKSDIILFEDKILIGNLGVLEVDFGFDQLIKESAVEGAKAVANLDILSGDSDIDKYIGKRPIRKQFAKLTSPGNLVMKEISGERIIEFIKDESDRFQKIKFDEEGKLVIKSEAAVRELLVVLNDNMLHSRLTGTNYEVRSKAVR